jgi:hypothetical protein
MAQSTYSLSFDGSTGYVTFSGPTLPAAHWSMSWWQKLDLSNTNQIIFADIVDTSNLVFFSVGNYLLIRDNPGAGGQSQTTVSAAQSPGSAWTHWALVNSGSGMQFYKNGTLIDTQNQLSDITPADIGNYIATYYYKGLLDDIAWFNTALTGAQIADIAGTPGVVGSSSLDVATLSPVALWRAEEGTGTTVGDTSGNNYNGTINGGVTWSTDVPAPLQGSTFPGEDEASMLYYPVLTW